MMVLFIFACSTHIRLLLMTPFNWLGDNHLMKAEWRSASIECGGQCVIVAGVPVMPVLCADS